MKRWSQIFFLGALLPALVSANPVNLPSLGSPSETLLSQSVEAQIGLSVIRELREAGLILEDPQINEYVQSLGQRLASHAHQGQFQFQFFVINDPSINAFALPGGYIGINSGLLMATRNESELAGVLAHEIAHTTQRHISRSVQAQQQSTATALASMLAAIVLGAMAGGDAALGALAVGQSLALEQQIAHTFSNELEADRVGIAILANAGFDPEGLPRFFEVLQRNYNNAQTQLPAFLRTHPLNAQRIAEGLNRARQMGRPSTLHVNSAGYEMAKARLRVITSSSSATALRWFEDESAANPARANELGMRYGIALASLHARAADRAVEGFRALVSERPELMPFHIGLAQAYAAAGQAEQAIQTYQNALLLSPRNRPLTIHYAETMIELGQADLAHAALLDLFNAVAPTPPQIRLIAQAASAAGLMPESHYYMAEYHIANGNAQLAIHQLRAALAFPNLHSVQRARYQARIDWILESVPDALRRQLEQEAANNSFLPSP